VAKYSGYGQGTIGKGAAEVYEVILPPRL